MENKKFDVVIFGATSFVGQIMTKHIAETIDNYPNLSWAIAGRSKDKLQTLKNELGGNFSKLNNFAGGIPELSIKISQIRTWTYISNNHKWLKNAYYWREKTKQIIFIIILAQS